MNAQTSIVAGDGVNWRDQPVIMSDDQYQVERAICRAEWEDRRGLYPTFAAWMIATCHALEDIDNRREAGREQQRRAMWAAYEKRKLS